MRIQFLSDIHLEVAPYVPAGTDADLVVLAGDIANGAAGIDWAARAFRVPVIYLAGNHEYYEGEFAAVQAALEDAAARTGVRLLDCVEHIVGDVRFLGCTLWTDYSLVAEGRRPRVIEASRTRNPDYELIRRGTRKFAPEDAI